MSGLALALLLAAARPAAAASGDFLVFRTDPRFELLGAVQLLAGAERRSAAFFRHDIPYDRAVEAHFKPFARHPVVERYLQLADAGLDNIRLYTWLWSLSPPPELAPRGEANDDIARRAGGAAGLREFALLLADFSKVSGFPAFYEQHAQEREAFIAQARASSRAAELDQAFARYAGVPAPARYEVILSPFAEPVMSVTFREKAADGSRLLTSVFGGEGDGAAFRFRTETRTGDVWRELFEAALAKRAPDWRERLKASAGLYEPIRNACPPDWQGCVLRHVAFAAAARLMTLDGNGEMAALWPTKYARIGMPYLGPLMERLKEYESSRSRYPTLESFAPRLLDVLDGIAAAAPPFLGRFEDSWHVAGPAVLIAPSGYPEEALERLIKKLGRRVSALGDSEALSYNLRGMTVLVAGTAKDNAWLAKRWEDLRLPAHLEDGGLRFNPRPGEKDPTFYPGRVGYASTALNPDDATRPLLLFTGTDAAAAAAALDADPGAWDFAVVEGTAPVKRGMYEKSRLPWRLK